MIYLLMSYISSRLWASEVKDRADSAAKPKALIKLTNSTNMQALIREAAPISTP